MSDRPTAFADLEDALRDLGSNLSFPEQPDVASAVMVRIREDRAAGVRPIRRSRRRPAPRLHRREGRRLRALVAAAVILVLGFTAVLILSPTARTAVARFLGLRGVRITVQPTVSVPPVHPGEHLALGQRMSLFEAGSKLPFRVLLPPDHVEGIALGAPDAVYLDPYLPTGKVTLVYGERPGLPKTKETGVGMLLAEFRGTLDEPSLQKSIRFGDATVESVVVNGEQGYFIRGEHAVEYREPSGLTRQDTVRLAGNTLLWERDGVTFRLESSLSKARALAIAERIA